MANTVKRAARTTLIAGILGTTAIIPAMHAAADPVEVPGIGTFEIPSHVAEQFAAPTFDVPAGTPSAITDIAAPEQVASQGQAVANAALSKVGSPYVWGATGPDSFDCSGLVQWAHNQVGASIPRTSQAQAGGGAPVSINNLQPGDVIAMYGGASHVAIYIGNGQVVHALNSSSPVKVDNLGDFPFHSARRYV
ncbi:C40 family peptidase [Hoyosella rhizosphaerae]|uniref:Endopeptidase Cgl2188 n=1 Tax=Hoyosella rhizosphaerae TaxID=1755582 RepID=A0A916XAN8_9ACTN|nr:C40 family peptidase [Hoyosella rhizosphaerae]MBN4926637.1 C40 family peptidase [Hoyosella rhizosphaerae]GGC57645.1 putative endopeptidase Cgl2188 [Hoyosella rhizosphaerae]